MSDAPKDAVECVMAHLTSLGGIQLDLPESGAARLAEEWGRRGQPLSQGELDRLLCFAAFLAKQRQSPAAASRLMKTLVPWAQAGRRKQEQQRVAAARRGSDFARWSRGT